MEHDFDTPELLKEGHAGLLVPGRTESQIDKDIFKIAATDFGTKQHWHKRLPRIGENTRHPLFVNRSDCVLKEDDICFVDVGPVFERIEADFGRTFVLGEPTPNTVAYLNAQICQQMLSAYSCQL